MKSIEFSEKELEVVILGLKEREERMFRDAQEYKKQDNKPAQFDCIHEMHTAQHLRERIQEAARNYQYEERMRAKEEARDYVEWVKEMERDRRNGAGTD